MINPIPILLRILKAPSITLTLDPFYYEVCTKPHPKLKIIPNKEYLVALMDEYFKDNYEIRKSIRNGNTFGLFKAIDWSSQMVTINVCNPERQGKPLPDYMYKCTEYEDHFGEKLLYGIFKDNKLIAYADVVKYGKVWVIGPFMGHADYLKEGIMYHLFDFIQRQHYPLMYDTFLGNTEGLTYFKKKLGFKEYNVIWRKEPK